jgi:TRAP-type C4-dicarboxylate transport system substrate-binding protein
VVVKGQELAQRFNQRANGKYKIELSAGGALATMEEEMDMLKAGAIQMAEFPIEYLSGSDIRFSAVTLPFLVKDMNANVAFLKNINQSLFNNILATKFNAMPLVVWTTGIHDYLGAKKPAKTLEDWKGQLVWVANPTEADAVKALGGSPVSLAFFDGYPALQKGTVDAGVGANPTGVWNFKWYDAIKYITVANMFGTSGYFDINLNVFNAMPKGIQQILLEESQRTENELITYMNQFAKDSLTELAKAGTQVYNLPDAERARWKEATKSVYDQYYSLIGAADAQKIQEAANKANQ